MSRFSLALIGLFIATIVTVALTEAEPVSKATPETDDTHVAHAEKKVRFDEDIRPIFAKNCITCHGGVRQLSDLSFIYRDMAMAGGASGEPAIVPGDHAASELYCRVSSDDPDMRMPPSDHGPPLDATQIELLKQWIDQGAQWEEHWAFTPPQRHENVQVGNPSWCRAPIDSFILRRLEAEGMEPSPEAPKAEWLRRVTFDLVGLPPTEAEVEAFLSDEGEDAYEKVVDRLLASPHFGERWASLWLDLARYADTVGFERDPHRNIWPYRDWVIRALNEDMPYRDFLVKQLAGDLLPNCSFDDRIASAFHRNTQTNTEGGTDDEEFRIMAVIDRIQTTWQVFGGLTFGCAQCHSHPYDPIKHDEFYQFMAYFNSARDVDVNEEYPLLSVPKNTEDFERANKLDQAISRCARWFHDKVKAFVDLPATWQYLTIEEVSAASGTPLFTQTVQEEQHGEMVDVPEVLSEGAQVTGVKYTLKGKPPTGMTKLTAVRMDVLPKDVEKALKAPENGFILTRLQLLIDRPGEEEPTEVEFAGVVCDDPHAPIDPEQSLHDNNEGWAEYSRIDRPHWAVFLLDKPVEIPQGSTLTFLLKHDRGDITYSAMAILRCRLLVSDDMQWIDLVGGKQWKTNRERYLALRADRNKIEGTRIPVMEELPADRTRKSYVFKRGNFLDKGREISPEIPAIFGSLADEEGPPRLALARWFASDDNPLTCRVFVNRIWEQLFGLGIVETVGDFGSSGIPPTHPELLDDLAVRFQTQHKWSLKRLLRELVLSAAYRQSSQATDELRERDPRNQLLSRGPRQRLTAEMVRDQALVLSGKFSDKMFGPPVMPPQPDGIWRSVYNNQKWVTSEGEDRYRRAVYTYWKRTSPYPSMTTFDAPSREVCSVQRVTTNTPLQALITLNDPVYVECAIGFADRMRFEGGDSPEEQIRWGYERATGKEVTETILQRLLKLYEESQSAFDPGRKPMQSLGVDDQVYALSIVAHVILNVDDVLVR